MNLQKTNPTQTNHSGRQAKHRDKIVPITPVKDSVPDKAEDHVQTMRRVEALKAEASKAATDVQDKAVQVQAKDSVQTATDPGSLPVPMTAVRHPPADAVEVRQVPELPGPSKEDSIIAIATTIIEIKQNLDKIKVKSALMMAEAGAETSVAATIVAVKITADAVMLLFRNAVRKLTIRRRKLLSAAV